MQSYEDNTAGSRNLLRSEQRLMSRICGRARMEVIEDFRKDSMGMWRNISYLLSPFDVWNEGLNLGMSQTVHELQIIIGKISNVSPHDQSDTNRNEPLKSDFILLEEAELRASLYKCGNCLHYLCRYLSMSQKNFHHLLKLNRRLSKKMTKAQLANGVSEMKIVEPCKECQKYQILLEKSKNQLSEISDSYSKANSEKEKAVMKYAKGEKNLIAAQKSLQALEKKKKLIMDENSSLKSNVNKLQDCIVQLSKTLRVKDSENLKLKNLCTMYKNCSQKVEAEESKFSIASPKKVDESKASKELIDAQVQTESDISYVQDEEAQTDLPSLDFSIAHDLDDCRHDQVIQEETLPLKTDEKLELEMEVEELKQREAALLEFVQKLTDKNVELQKSVMDSIEELHRAKDDKEFLTTKINTLHLENKELHQALSSQIKDSDVLADYIAQQLSVNQRLLHEVEELNGANRILLHRCKAVSRGMVQQSH
ncbi:hypothetical protein QAD02_019182 [Eretmocerus hayati]|uniref:Uncharacterized protein n=1 Tax=Eretmocerus hayati TaxID=131215 RepID=A0ACC2PIY9_9HYME|nr:hypothetical protein QAD02_019182 [Eretmocerus hayati]